MDILDEIESISFWFYEYDKKIAKLSRLQRLNKFTDDGKLPKDEIEVLDYEAERKRKRIQELEKQLES